MAVYKSTINFVEKIALEEFPNRAAYLEKVKFATIKDVSRYKKPSGVKEVGFMQAFNLMDKGEICADCSHEYKLEQKLRKARAKDGGSDFVEWVWRGGQSDMCDTCCDDRCSATKDTIVGSSAVAMWPHILDLAVMWSLEYSKQTTMAELPCMFHGTVESWIRWCQNQVITSMEGNDIFEDISELAPQYCKTSRQGATTSYDKNQGRHSRGPVGKIVRIALSRSQAC